MGKVYNSEVNFPASPFESNQTFFIGYAFFRQNILCIGYCRFVTVQRKGIDADYRAALLGKLLVQLFQIGKLTNAWGCRW